MFFVPVLPWMVLTDKCTYSENQKLKKENNSEKYVKYTVYEYYLNPSLNYFASIRVRQLMILIYFFKYL